MTRMATNGKATNGAPAAPAEEESEEFAIEPFDRGEAPCPEAPAHVLELVASCHRMVAAAVGVPMDGTGDTLSLLDHYVTQARADLLAQRAREVALVHVERAVPAAGRGAS